MPKSKAEKAKVGDLSIPRSYSLGTVGLSQSLLGAWQTCPRRFLFALNQWKNPAQERNFGYGSMIHEALDAIYTAAAEGNKDLRFLSGLGLKAIDAFIFPAVFKADEAETLKAIGEAIITNYLKFYAADFRDLRFDRPERIFAQRFAGAMLRGKIDGRFRDKNGGRWHIEHKNLSRISEDVMQKKLSFDLQNLFYLIADEIEFPGEEVSGVLYNVLRRPDLRKEMPIGQIRKYVSDLIEKDPKHYFIRWEIPYTRDDRAQFRAELSVKLDRLGQNIGACRLYGASALSMFYKNECACEAPYPCAFLDACASGTLVGFEKTKTLFTELQPKTETKTKTKTKGK